MSDITKKEKGEALDIGTLRIRSSAILKSTAQQFGMNLQVVFMFDITGSMFSFFQGVREKIQEIVNRLKKDIGRFQISVFAYRNHGDEDQYEEIYYALPFTDDLPTMIQFLSQVKKGGGGSDALTCMEDCLKQANRLGWIPNIPKALVVIGDMPPHGVLDKISHCPEEVNYKEEIDNLISKKVKIYSVYCGNREKVEAFFRNMAESSGGKFLPFDDIDLLSELLIGIAMKETGQLKKFFSQIRSLPHSEKNKKELLKLLGGTEDG